MRSLSGASLAGAAVLALSLMPACAKVGELKAMKSFKAGNQAYQGQDFKKAAQLYEETIQAAPDTAQAHQAYFFLGNSYDQQFKPSKKGDKDNDALLTKAAQNYQAAAEKLAQSSDPNDKKLGKLSLEYLVAVYGPDKLNDPAKAEPVVQRMIQLEPGEPTNYFALAKIYEDAGAYDNAEQMLLKAKEVKPNDPDVYGQLAGYYNRQGEFQKTIEALEQGAAKQPNNPEGFYKIATYYWDEAYRDARLKEPQKKEFVQKGIAATDRALEIKSDYADALVYKNLLLRLAANFEKDPKKQQEYIKEADKLRDKAIAIKKQKTAGVGD
jgi:tetratricopeptide (TPR) repeat protein